MGVLGRIGVGFLVAVALIAASTALGFFKPEFTVEAP